MVPGYKHGNYRKLQFNALRKSAEMVISHGLVILDKAELNNCSVDDAVIRLS
jgi:hypothetical protein